MDFIFFFFSGLVGLGLLLAIAFPDRFIPDHPMKKKRKVGSSYWGVYQDGNPLKSVGDIEVAPLTDKQITNYGAFSYAAGKGVSRRGA